MLQDTAVRAAGILAAARDEAPKHRRLLRTPRDGKILSALMLPFFMLRPPTGFGVLTTTGRKSGTPRRRCMRFARHGHRVYLVALRPPELAIVRPGSVAAWVWNIRANPRVSVRMRGGTFPGVAREVVDAAERAQAREALCDTINLLDYGECILHLKGRPSRSKIRELHRYWFETGIPFAIELQERSAHQQDPASGPV
jgi:deazaflavin-dependent oxidoreductase (nitroreductase family)